MFELSRLLASTGKTGRRCVKPRATLHLEELENRVVPTLLGQQLFPSDYPWNQGIANAPVAANSAAIMSHIGNAIKIHPDWGQDNASNGTSPLYGIPFNVVHGNTTAKVNVIIDNYPGESDMVGVPIPANAVIEGDYQGGPNPHGPGNATGQRGDSHLIVWDEDNNVAYELYGAARPSDPNTLNGGLTNGQWHAAQESVWNMNTDSFRSLGYTSADAAGLSILAGLARPDEGLPASQGGQGMISHALRFTLPPGDVNPQYIYPASHVVSGSSSSTKLPFGARLRLMNTPAVNALINAMQPEAQIIAHAMQRYGLVLADIGSAMYVTGTSASENASNVINFTWNMNDVLGLSALTAANFEVVNLTPIVTGLNMTTGSGGNTITVVGQNFAGAAGQLKVLFGNTAATSVTYVDDSHLTVVVPSGSGTVDVRVQSGVNKTDPNNPNDNVNNPIFGYGISAVSTADQFTYINQTISPTNSTASFATATIAPNNVDVLTIIVKDTGGNTVSGLPNSVFSLGLSGGTSAGSFGSVTETATHGTYTVTFTGITMGTPATLTVVINGVTLGTAPIIQVSATGSLDADHRYIQALYQDVLGRTGGPSELDGWVAYLNFTNRSFMSVTNAIEQSDEARIRLVKGWYSSYLGRPASNAEAQSWLPMFANGANEDQVQAIILGSGEFAARANALIGNADPNVNYIGALYFFLFNRTAATSEVNGWLPGLASVGKVAVAQIFLEVAERRTFIVSSDYTTLLHRTPSPGEVSGWANCPAPLQAIRYMFESSGEFYVTG